MDRYQRIERPRPETAINENEIRITTQGLIRNYITYASTLLQEKQVREVVLKAMGQAINKAVAIAEIIKKRILGLHQDTAISSISITDIWEPIEEGLVPLEMTRHVSMISISLSFRELNKNSPGYQPPTQAEHTKPPNRQQISSPQQQRQYLKQAPGPAAVPNEDMHGGRGQAQGRGRGWGRGGYVSNQRFANSQGYGNNQGYRNNQVYGNSQRYDNRQRYGNNQRDGYNQGYGNNQRYDYNQGYGNNQRYDNSQGYGYNQRYVNNQAYGNDEENDGWNWNRGGRGRRGRGWGYRGAGYERGRGGGGGRSYARGRGRMGGPGRGIQA